MSVLMAPGIVTADELPTLVMSPAQLPNKRPTFTSRATKLCHTQKGHEYKH